MNSIAIWYEQNGNAPGNRPELDLHINHWKLKFNRSFWVRKLRSLSTKTIGRKWERFVFQNSDYFMDLGLKIKNGENVESVCIYVPNKFTDKKKLVADLGTRLSDKRLITAVFNEPYNTTTVTDGKYFSVIENSIPLFNIYMLDIDCDINIENKYHGTIIKFPFKIFNNLPTYYRFRLKAPFVNNLSYFFKPSNSFLESVYSSIEIIDFRINDTRNLDVSLIEHINEQQKFNLALVHYFVMRNVKDEYVVSNQNMNGVRQLEDKTWTSYIDDSEYLYEKSFAYHLKRKASEIERSDKRFIDEFSAVLKFRFEDGKLVRYIVFAIILAMLTEVFGNGLYDLCKPYLLNIYHFVIGH